VHRVPGIAIFFNQTESYLKHSWHSIRSGIRIFSRAKQEAIVRKSKSYLEKKYEKWQSLNRWQRIGIVLAWTLSPIPGGIFALMAELSLSIKNSDAAGKILEKILKDEKDGLK